MTHNVQHFKEDIFYALEFFFFSFWIRLLWFNYWQRIICSTLQQKLDSVQMGWYFCPEKSGVHSLWSSEQKKYLKYKKLDMWELLHWACALSLLYLSSSLNTQVYLTIFNLAFWRLSLWLCKPFIARSPSCFGTTFSLFDKPIWANDPNYSGPN